MNIRAAALLLSTAAWTAAGPQVDVRPSGPVALELRCGPGCSARLDVAARLATVAGAGWTTLVVPLRCLVGADLSHVTAPFALSTSGRMRLSLSSIALVSAKGSVPCS